MVEKVRGGVRMVSNAYNIDCVKYMEKMPDCSVDLTVTSPPYDNLRDYNGYRFDYESSIENLFRVTKQGGVVVWIVNDQTVNGSETGTSFKQALFAIQCGFKLHDTMIWEKDSCAFPESSRYYPLFEYMFIFSKGKPKTFNPIEDRKNKWGGHNVHGTFREKDGRTRNRGETWSSTICKEYGKRFNVWHIPSEKNNRTGHPAVFPIRLAKDHIISWSNAGDTVFDPFLGSGTTRIASWETGRNFIGCEIDKTYFEQQEDRFRKYAAQLSLI